MAHVESDISQLKDLLLTMASRAEMAVKQATEALEARDYDLALRVLDGDEAIDRLEVQVDEMAIQLLAKAPLGTDLRFVAVTMKISQNLERVGDEATKIAKRARDLSQELPLKVTVDLPRLADMAVEMLDRALDAFVNQDPEAARALVPEDKQVDALNKEIHCRLAELMTRDAEVIPRCLHLMVVAKSLERIADHAKNVAEEVVYLCEAKDIRHSEPGNSAVQGMGHGSARS
jgi:phosphate transport system protein